MFSNLGCLLLCSAIFLPFCVDAQEISQRLYAVEVSAIVQTAPPLITLQWPVDTNATLYTLSRKRINETNWTPLTALGGTATQFQDPNVSVGSAFEYQILKTTSRGYTGSGYVYSGINVPATEARGKAILLVDSTMSVPLQNELRTLQADLIGDGWSLIRREVSRTAAVPAVRALIQSIYAMDPQNTKALFLFGHIPVPYSGDAAPDSHDNHKGAWPADSYYADIDGTWTDTTVNDVLGEKQWNHNVPGDGKFDQSEIPSDLELQVGRVDLYYMTCYSNKTPARDEETLLRQYLNKDHNFRHGLLNLPRRGLICDNFSDSEALASTGWRSFSALFGASQNVMIPWGSYFSTLNTDGYLFAYGDGGGAFYTCAGIGSADDFALNDIKAVFTFYFGSYFGDWDNESNFMRASLGSTTYTLTTAWGGRPHWFVHHMGLGETIGYSARLSQNNATNGVYSPPNVGTRGVHTALFGDPTLRLHPVKPVGNLLATLGTGVNLSWTSSPDTAIQGYYVYRSSSRFGPFTRISGANPVAGTTFSDASGTASSVYMVRALKLETSASGTYYNLSQGILTSPTGTFPGTPTGFRVSGTSAGS